MPDEVHVDNWSSLLARALKVNDVRMIAYVPDEVTDRLLAKLEADPEAGELASIRVFSALDGAR